MNRDISTDKQVNEYFDDMFNSSQELPSDMQKDIILQFHTYYQEEVLLPLLIKLILTK